MAKLSTQPNRFYPSIPGVTEDVPTHTNALQQIRESIETHERRNANYLKSFIRFEELVELGIIDEDGNFILEIGGGTPGPGGATELNDLDDVTIAAPLDNDILGYNFATSQWTNQNAAELNLATLDDLVGLDIPDSLSDLSDVDTSGANTHDLLHLTGAGWRPTAGQLQWDGSDLHIPTGDIRFYSVGGGVEQSIKQNSPLIGSLQMEVPSGGIFLTPATYVQVDSDFRMPNNRGIRWYDSNDVAQYFLRQLTSAGPSQDLTDAQFVQDNPNFDVGSATFTDTPNTFIDVSQLVDGDEYFYYFEVGFGNSITNSTNGNQIRLVYDGVELPGSLGIATDAEGANFPYQYGGVQVVDTTAGDIQLQQRQANTSFNCRTRERQAFAINTTRLGANNFLYSEDLTGVTYGTTATDSAASVTLSAGDWLVFVNGWFDGLGGGGSTNEHIVWLRDGTTDYQLTGHEVENTTTQPALGGLVVLEGVTEGTVATTAVSASATGGTSNRQMIAAIKLSGFAEYYTDYVPFFDDPGVGQPAVASVSFTAQTSGEFTAIAGSSVFQPNGNPSVPNIEVQINGGGYTVIGDAHRRTDEGAANYQGYVALPDASFTVTAGDTVDVRVRFFDGSNLTAEFANHTSLAVFSLATGPTAVDRFLVGNSAFQLELDGTLIRLDNSVGVNWQNIAGDDVELLVLGLAGSPGGIVTETGVDFAGNGGSLMSIPDSSDFDIASDLYTIEFDVFLDQTATAKGNNLTVIDKRVNGPQFGWNVTIVEGSNALSVNGWASGNPTPVLGITGTTSFTANQLYRCAVVRDTGGVWSLYVDGVREAQVTESGPIGGNGSQVQFGVSNNSFDGNRPLDGKLDNIRLTRTVARYSGATITQDPTPFPTSIAGDPNYNSVEFLTDCNGTVGQTTLTDQGPDGRTVTLTNSSLQQYTLADPGAEVETFVVGDQTLPVLIEGTVVNVDADTIVDSLTSEGAVTVENGATLNLFNTGSADSYRISRNAADLQITSTAFGDFNATGFTNVNFGATNILFGTWNGIDPNDWTRFDQIENIIGEWNFQALTEFEANTRILAGNSFEIRNTNNSEIASFAHDGAGLNLTFAGTVARLVIGSGGDLIVDGFAQIDESLSIGNSFKMYQGNDQTGDEFDIDIQTTAVTLTTATNDNLEFFTRGKLFGADDPTLSLQNLLAVFDAAIHVENGRVIRTYDVNDIEYLQMSQGNLIETSAQLNIFVDSLARVRIEPTAVEVNPALYLLERAAAEADQPAYGQLWVNSADDSLNYRTEAGVNFDLTATGGGAVDSFEGRTGAVVAQASDYADVATTFTANQRFDGQLLVDTDSNTNPLIVSRLGSVDQAMSLGVEDVIAHMRYDNDEISGTIRFTIDNADTETGGGVGANTGFIDFFHSNTQLNLDLDTDGSQDMRIRMLNSAGGSVLDHASTGGLQIQQTSAAGALEDVWVSMVRNGGVQLRYNNVAQIATGALGLQIDVPQYLFERASANTDSAGFGQLWVRNDTPNVLMFTDDGGTDHQLTPPASGGGAEFVRRTSNLDRNSTTTVSNDTQLQLTGLEAGFYRLDYLFKVRDIAVSGCGFKFDFTGTSVIDGTHDATIDTFAGISTSARRVVGTIFDDFTFPSLDTGSGTSEVIGSGYVRIGGTGAATFIMRWSQNTSNANNLRVETNSFISLTRLGS